MQDDRSQPEDASELLQLQRDAENKREDAALRSLLAGQLGARAPRLYRSLADGLLLLTHLGSCAWGCRHSDHLVENLARRSCNFAFGSLRLGGFGYYDEALALVRGLAEIVNLVQLFRTQPSSLAKWQSLDPRKRAKEYSPLRVRLELEQGGQQPVTDSATYARLCEIGIHVSPVSAALSHDLEDGRLYVGAQFSEPGFFLVLSELSHLIGNLLPLGAALVDADELHQKKCRLASQELVGLVGDFRVTNYEKVLDRFRTN